MKWMVIILAAVHKELTFCTTLRSQRDSERRGFVTFPTVEPVPRERNDELHLNHRTIPSKTSHVGMWRAIWAARWQSGTVASQHESPAFDSWAVQTLSGRDFVCSVTNYWCEVWRGFHCSTGSKGSIVSKCLSTHGLLQFQFRDFDTVELISVQFSLFSICGTINHIGKQTQGV